MFNRSQKCLAMGSKHIADRYYNVCKVKSVKTSAYILCALSNARNNNSGKRNMSVDPFLQLFRLFVDAHYTVSNWEIYRCVIVLIGEISLNLILNF